MEFHYPFFLIGKRSLYEKNKENIHNIYKATKMEFHHPS